MKQTETIYEAPRAEAFQIIPEGMLCSSRINAGTATGASWTDETDASLEW